MTENERGIIDDLVVRLRALLVAPEFGTTEQAKEVEDIADQLELLLKE
jgi:hypothetical protein